MKTNTINNRLSGGQVLSLDLWTRIEEMLRIESERRQYRNQYPLEVNGVNLAKFLSSASALSLARTFSVSDYVEFLHTRESERDVTMSSGMAVAAQTEGVGGGWGGGREGVAKGNFVGHLSCLFPLESLLASCCFLFLSHILLCYVILEQTVRSVLYVPLSVGPELSLDFTIFFILKKIPWVGHVFFL